MHRPLQRYHVGEFIYKNNSKLNQQELQLKIERLITVFDNKTERLKEKINIDYIELLDLKKIFNPANEDPLMYMVYEIKKEFVLPMNDLLIDKIAFDFQKYSYYVECVQLPTYDFGK